MTQLLPSDLEYIEGIRQWAHQQHANVNHLYDGKPYGIAHLDPVVDVLCRYEYIFDSPRYGGTATAIQRVKVLSICAALCHDILEDTHNSYNDLVKVVGVEVADIVFALTNLRGKTRHEKAGPEYYELLRNTPYASLIKICDRIANVENSIQSGNSMAAKYARENEHFTAELFRYHLLEPLNDLKQLFVNIK